MAWGIPKNDLMTSAVQNRWRWIPVSSRGKLCTWQQNTVPQYMQCQCVLWTLYCTGEEYAEIILVFRWINAELTNKMVRYKADRRLTGYRLTNTDKISRIFDRIYCVYRRVYLRYFVHKILSCMRISQLAYNTLYCAVHMTCTCGCA
jgi:hypothetical protein